MTPAEAFAQLAPHRQWRVHLALDRLHANPQWLARVICVTERATAELAEEEDLRQRLVDFLARAGE